MAESSGEAEFIAILIFSSSYAKKARQMGQPVIPLALITPSNNSLFNCYLGPVIRSANEENLVMVSAWAAFMGGFCGSCSGWT